MQKDTNLILKIKTCTIYMYKICLQKERMYGCLHMYIHMQTENTHKIRMFTYVYKYTNTENTYTCMLTYV